MVFLKSTGDDEVDARRVAQQMINYECGKTIFDPNGEMCKDPKPFPVEEHDGCVSEIRVHMGTLCLNDMVSQKRKFILQERIIAYLDRYTSELKSRNKINESTIIWELSNAYGTCYQSINEDSVYYPTISSLSLSAENATNKPVVYRLISNVNKVRNLSHNASLGDIRPCHVWYLTNDYCDLFIPSMYTSAEFEYGIIVLDTNNFTSIPDMTLKISYSMADCRLTKSVSNLHFPIINRMGKHMLTCWLRTNNTSRHYNTYMSGDIYAADDIDTTKLTLSVINRDGIVACDHCHSYLYDECYLSCRDNVVGSMTQAICVMCYHTDSTGTRSEQNLKKTNLIVRYNTGISFADALAKTKLPENIVDLIKSIYEKGLTAAEPESNYMYTTGNNLLLSSVRSIILKDVVDKYDQGFTNIFNVAVRCW
jgi:hypothetical protein